MILVDSHCHLDFNPLGSQIRDVLAKAESSSVKYMLCVAVNLEDYPSVLALAEKHKNIFASVGVHPNSTDGEDPGRDRLAALADNPRVVAIGETGLDYFRSQGDLGWQRDRFVEHIEAAKLSNKPLIIHARDAANDIIAMLRDHKADQVGGVMHCFSENWEIALQALDLGFYISFSGIVTFKSADKLREVAQKMPLGRMLIETDAPYLAPVPHRGKTNQPAYVSHTADCIAELRNISLEAIAQATTENFFNLFEVASKADAA